MKTIEELEKQKQSIQAEIDRLDDIDRQQRCAPLIADLHSMQNRLQRVGAWPVAIIVDFHFGNTWVHANEAHLNFAECASAYVRSTSSWGSPSNRFSLGGAFEKHSVTRRRDLDPYLWKNFFEGVSAGYIPLGKEMLNMFVPQQTGICDVGERRECGAIFFRERVVCCPLCYRLQLDPSDNRTRSDYGSFWQHPETQRKDRYILRGLIENAKAILSGKLFDNGLVFRRCCDCSGLSFLDNWKRLHKHILKSLPGIISQHEEEMANSVLRHIESIWPDRIRRKDNANASIFRQAKKRLKVKPLSRGEIAFFSMHLAASEIKKLKANNGTHANHQIINQAN